MHCTGEMNVIMYDKIVLKHTIEGLQGFIISDEKEKHLIQTPSPVFWLESDAY